MTLKDEIADARRRLEEIRYGPGVALAGKAERYYGGETALSPSGPDDGRWIPAIRRAHAAASAAGYIAALPREERDLAVVHTMAVIQHAAADEDEVDRKALAELEALITEAERAAVDLGEAHARETAGEVARG